MKRTPRTSEIRSTNFETRSSGAAHPLRVRISNFEFRVSSSPRPGFSLIELLAVTTMTLVIAGSACMLMSKMMRASHVQAESLVRQRTLHLWETQFRQDGRLAQSAQVVAEPSDKIGVEFQHPGGSVTYQVISGGLERRVQGELGGRWECSSGEWSFTLLEGDRIVRAEELSLSSQLPQGAPAVPQWTRTRVDVALGSNQRGDQ